MLSSHEAFRFADKGTGKELIAEVNWEGDDKCQRVRFTFPNGDKLILDRSELNAMLFAIGAPEDQRKMIPSVERRSRWYETVVSIEAKRDVRKGEKITFPLKLTLPTFEEEVIAEAKKDLIKSNYPII